MSVAVTVSVLELSSEGLDEHIPQSHQLILAMPLGNNSLIEYEKLSELV